MVQVLIDTCKEVFENCGPGIIPTPENIQRLKDVMGMLMILFIYLHMLLLVCVSCIGFSELSVY